MPKRRSPPSPGCSRSARSGAGCTGPTGWAGTRSATCSSSGAALERTESRGAHTRSDYPDSDERQAREHIVIKKEGDRMLVRREAQPPLPADLMQLIKEGA